MCTTTELKKQVDDLAKEIEHLRGDTELTKTSLRFLLSDVKYVKDKTDEQIKWNQKHLEALKEREQFFIDSVIDMKKTLAEFIKKAGKNGKD